MLTTLKNIFLNIIGLPIFLVLFVLLSPSCLVGYVQHKFRTKNRKFTYAYFWYKNIFLWIGRSFSRMV